MKIAMKTILVLDDDRIILDLLQTVLTDAGYNAVVAPSAAAIPPDVSADLVITDLVPLKAYHRDAALGWVASLRKRFAGSPLLIVTAHRPAAEERDRLGASGVLTKPFDIDVLLAKVDELLA